jgi:hypothetical protein
MPARLGASALTEGGAGASARSRFPKPSRWPAISAIRATRAIAATAHGSTSSLVRAVCFEGAGGSDPATGVPQRWQNLALLESSAPHDRQPAERNCAPHEAQKAPVASTPQAGQEAGLAAGSFSAVIGGKANTTQPLWRPGSRAITILHALHAGEATVRFPGIPGTKSGSADYISRTFSLTVRHAARPRSPCLTQIFPRPPCLPSHVRCSRTSLA